MYIFLNNMQSNNQGNISFSVPKLEKVPSKDIQILSMSLRNSIIDDSTLLLKYPHYKIRSVTIYNNYFAKFLSGLQFSYIDTQTKFIVQGRLIGRGKYDSSTSITLQQNEYITQVFGRTGAIIDKLGFKTNFGQVASIGGEGGIEFSYKLPEGYQIGAVSCALHKYLNCFSFDLRIIPKVKAAHDAELRNKRKFIFFQDQRKFDFAIRYLSVKDILMLSRVNKRLLNFTRRSQVFWMQCIYSGDIILLAYLNEISHNDELLSQFLQLHKWTPVTITTFKQQLWKGQAASSKISGESISKGKFLFIIGVEFINSNFYNTELCLKDRQKTIKKNSIKSEKKSFSIFPYMARKFAIWIDFDHPDSRAMEGLTLQSKVSTDWYEAYSSEIVGVYGIRMEYNQPCFIEKILQKYSKAIWIGEIRSVHNCFKCQ